MEALNQKQNEGTLMERIVSLCKRRGFIFSGSEIYGGLAGTWDYGPLGVELKNNVKRAWWKKMVQERHDVVGLDSSILMNAEVWKASGHVAHFTDPLVDCKKCKKRFRADKVGDKCPECGGELTEIRQFNLLFQTFVGPVQDEAAKTYLRPETCQGIFTNFENVLNSSRMKIPFGIAQIGKAFRNEITPGNFIFRSREFEQMELEFFVKPGEDDKWHDYWKKERLKWYLDLGIKKENLRLRDYEKQELAHYSKATTDIEYAFPFAKDGWDELEGIANRTDFDLKNHAKASGRDLGYYDEQTKEKYIPYVIEPSAGVDRATLAFLLDAYEEIKGGRTTTTKATKEVEVVLRLHKDLAPIKVAVLPLSKKEPLIRMAHEIVNQLCKYWVVQYDEVASIGRRYRRQDEIGTPYCITVDFESLEDKAVTVRDRDTMKQDRISVNELISYFQNNL